MNVTILTAVLADEKGFDVPSRDAYDVKDEVINSSIYYNGNEFFESDDIKNAIEATGTKHVLAPTQSDLQKWLRDTHQIRVYPENKTSGMFGFTIYIPTTPERRAAQPFERVTYWMQSFRTYEEALEQGLLEGLKLIKL